MPYFWETEKWSDRLQEKGISLPPRSGCTLHVQRTDEKDVMLGLWKGLMAVDPSHIKEDEQQGKDTSTQELIMSLFNKAMNTMVDSNMELRDDYLLPALCEMLQVKEPGISLAEELMTRKGYSCVHMTSELLHIRRGIENFFRRLSTFLEEHDSRFKLRPTQIGSMAEECRPGYGDEYDYRLDLVAVDKETISTLSNNSTDIDRIYKLINNPEDSLHFLQNLYPCIDATLMSLSDEQDSELRFVGHGITDNGILYVCLFWHEGLADQLLIKIDCVPAIPCQGVWPSTRMDDPLKTAVEKKAHLILKYETVAEVVIPKWSVCAAEQAFMARLPRQVKDGYVLAKIIWSPSLLASGTFATTFSSMTTPTSYQMKNAFFKCIDEGKVKLPSTEFSNLSEAVDNALSIADAIFRQLSESNIESFFMPGKMLGPLHPPMGRNIACDAVQQLWKQHRSRRLPRRADGESEDGSKEETDFPLANDFSAAFSAIMEMKDSHQDDFEKTLLRPKRKRKTATLFSETFSHLLAKGYGNICSGEPESSKATFAPLNDALTSAMLASEHETKAKKKALLSTLGGTLLDLMSKRHSNRQEEANDESSPSTDQQVDAYDSDISLD